MRCSLSRPSFTALAVLAVALALLGCGDSATNTRDSAPLVDSGADGRDGAAVDAPAADAPASDASAADAPASDTMAGDGAESDGTSGADGPASDALLGDAGAGDAAQTKLKDICFQNIGDPNKQAPDYDQFKPTYASHCHGTDHQDIKGVQKVVFVGDSVTAGTPPTWPADYYRNRLVKSLEQKFGKLEVKDCSKWGARTDDLLLPPHKQILDCIPDPTKETKKTLVVMTIGGNDMHAFSKSAADGKPIKDILKDVDKAVKLMRDAIEWFRKPGHFPAGVYVVFGNIYEYTDGTGDLFSCPTAFLGGIKANWPEGRAAHIRMNEQFMKIAVDTGSDVIFMLENFCGHGFKHGDPNNECYRGAGSKIWFDLTCIHPNPDGHKQIADMFMSVINK